MLRSPFTRFAAVHFDLRAPGCTRPKIRCLGFSYCSGRHSFALLSFILTFAPRVAPPSENPLSWIIAPRKLTDYFALVPLDLVHVPSGFGHCPMQNPIGLSASWAVYHSFVRFPGLILRESRRKIHYLE